MTDYREPTETEVAEMTAAAYDFGLDAAYDYDGVTDYERLLAVFEVGEIDLGSDGDSPTIRAVKAAYRRGKREQG